MTSGKQAQAAVVENIRATPFTRIPGKLTRRDYITLKNEACEAACAEDSSYTWSGDFGHLAIVTGAAEYLILTTAAGTPLVYVRETAPEAFNPTITQATSDYQTKKKSAEWEERRENWYTLCGVEDGLCANFRAAVDEQYYRQLKKPIIGYRGLKIKDYLDHLDVKWCKLDTEAIKEMKANYYQKWTADIHITDFGKQLDDEQAQLATTNITIPEADKLQFYIEQMYASRYFNREMMIAWEDKTTANKTWATAKTYFEGETAKIETYQSNTNSSSAEARYESAANMTDQGDALRDYLESLKAADSAQNIEYMQQMSSTQDKYQEQTKAKDEQITQLSKQNEAILSALAKLSENGGKRSYETVDDKENAPPNNRRRNPNRPEREKCIHGCGSYHRPEKCWEQPANKNEWPPHWKSRLAKPLE